MNRRIAVRAVIVRNKQILAVRLQSKADRPEAGTFWCLPGGGLEEGEDLISGLTREMVEETGIKPDISQLLYVQQFKDDRSEYLEFFFHATNSEDYEHIDLSQTSHGTIEIADVAFIDPAANKLLPVFLATTSFERDIANGKTQYFNNL